MNATFRKHSKLTIPQNPNKQVGGLVIRPFKRRIDTNFSKEYAADHKAEDSFFLFSLLTKVGCCYCNKLISMRSTSCPYCKRGLKLYWLWERVVFKRRLFLFGLFLLFLFALIKIFLGDFSIFTN